MERKFGRLFPTLVVVSVVVPILLIGMALWSFTASEIYNKGLILPGETIQDLSEKINVVFEAQLSKFPSFTAYILTIFSALLAAVSVAALISFRAERFVVLNEVTKEYYRRSNQINKTIFVSILLGLLVSIVSRIFSSIIVNSISNMLL